MMIKCRIIVLSILALCITGCNATPNQPVESNNEKIDLDGNLDNNSDVVNSTNKKIVLDGHLEGKRDIWAINASGDNLQNLTNTTDIAEVNADISNDGSMIAFYELMSRNVFIISSDGSGLRQLTFDENVLSRSTYWSSDGKRLLICTDHLLADNSTTSSDAFYFEIISGEKQYVDECLDQTSYSPDGTKYYDLSKNKLTIYSLSGAEPQVFILGPAEEMLYGISGWSPDGSRILFGAITWRSDNYQKPPMNIQILNVDSGGMRDLTHDQYVNQSPSWSPDGEKIAFVSDRLNGEGHLQPFIINEDGTGIRLLAEIYSQSLDW